MASQYTGLEGLWIFSVIFVVGVAVVWLLVVVGLFLLLRRHKKDAAEWRESRRAKPANPKIK